MPKQLLIADDAPFMRRILRQIVEEAGWEVLDEVSTSEQAVERTRERKPTLVLLDLSLSKHGGIDLIAAVRDASPSTAVVVVSPLDQKETLETVRNAGAIDFVVKPFEKSRLLEALTKVATK